MAVGSTAGQSKNHSIILSSWSYDAGGVDQDAESRIAFEK
jgi:hypothetical protein